jgi:hypothetical protein
MNKSRTIRLMPEGDWRIPFYFLVGAKKDFIEVTYDGEGKISKVEKKHIRAEGKEKAKELKKGKQ